MASIVDSWYSTIYSWMYLLTMYEVCPARGSIDRDVATGVGQENGDGAFGGSEILYQLGASLKIFTERLLPNISLEQISLLSDM